MQFVLYLKRYFTNILRITHWRKFTNHLLPQERATITRILAWPFFGVGLYAETIAD